MQVVVNTVGAVKYNWRCPKKLFMDIYNSFPGVRNPPWPYVRTLIRIKMGDLILASGASRDGLTD